MSTSVQPMWGVSPDIRITTCSATVADFSDDSSGYLPSTDEATDFFSSSSCSNHVCPVDASSSKHANRRDDASSTCECNDRTHVSFADDSSDSEFGDDEFMEYTRITRRYPPMLLLHFRTTSKPSNVLYRALRIDEIPGWKVASSSLRNVASEPRTGSALGARTPPMTKRGKVSLASPGGSSSANQQEVFRKRLVRSDDEAVGRAIRSILNKLTVEKFDALAEQLGACGMSTPGHVMLLMKEIFEKAIGQHHFIAMYADLCARLGDDPRIVSAVGSKSDVTFRRLLLNTCQVTFEKLLEPQVDGGIAFDDEFLKLRRKQSALGNVKLIGELLVRGMVSSKILCTCMDDLLLARGHCPEALEALAALLTVAGPHFDKAQWQHHPLLEVAFNRVRELAHHKGVPARERFLLRDVLDLREAGWLDQARAPARTAGPMRLEEVRRKAQDDPSHRSLASGSPKSLTPKSYALGSSAGVLMKSEQTLRKHQRNDKAKDWKGTKGSRTAAAGASAVAAARTARGEAGVAELLSCRGMCAASKEETSKTDAKPVVKQAGVAAAPFSSAAFHRALCAILRQLSDDGNVSAATQKIEVQQVPSTYQANAFADLLTRGAEEKFECVRRSVFSLARRLASHADGIFVRTECLVGLGYFFGEIYEELLEEVPHVRIIVYSELLPELRLAFSEEEWSNLPLDKFGFS